MCREKLWHENVPQLNPNFIFFCNRIIDKNLIYSIKKWYDRELSRWIITLFCYGIDEGLCVEFKNETDANKHLEALADAMSAKHVKPKEL